MYLKKEKRKKEPQIERKALAVVLGELTNRRPRADILMITTRGGF